MELVRNFAVANGYQLELMTMNFAGVISSITTGMIDMACSGISITEERKKSIFFSEPYYNAATVVFTVVADEAGVEKAPWYESIAESFHNNIIKEKRYNLILDGLIITIIISLLSIILGTILGGGICYLSMSKYKAYRAFASGFITIVRGTPVLVLLMINFYVIFASSNISPVAVAVISFAINFAAYVSEMFRTSIESIDRGQTEAGLAMGFTGVKTFIYIIAPQAIKQVLPVYKGESISLIKMTSVVGYIAVQDITKVGDIIRSRTFDAFFPLIVSAVLYFILAYLFAKLLDLSMARIIRRR